MHARHAVHEYYGNLLNVLGKTTVQMKSIWFFFFLSAKEVFNWWIIMEIEIPVRVWIHKISVELAKEKWKKKNLLPTSFKEFIPFWVNEHFVFFFLQCVNDERRGKKTRKWPTIVYMNYFVSTHRNKNSHQWKLFYFFIFFLLLSYKTKDWNEFL